MNIISTPFKRYNHHELYTFRIDIDDTILFTPLNKNTKAKKKGNNNSLKTILPNNRNPKKMSMIPPANHHPQLCLFRFVSDDINN